MYSVLLLLGDFHILKKIKKEQQLQDTCTYRKGGGEEGGGGEKKKEVKMKSRHSLPKLF